MEKESVSTLVEDEVMQIPDQQEVEMDDFFIPPEPPQPGPEVKPDSQVFLEVVIEQAGGKISVLWEKKWDSAEDVDVQRLNRETCSIEMVKEGEEGEEVENLTQDIQDGKVENAEKYSEQQREMIDALLAHGEYVYIKETPQENGGMRQQVMVFRVGANDIIHGESYERTVQARQPRIRNEQESDGIEEMDSDDEAREPLLAFSLLPSCEESTQAFEVEPRTEELPSPAEVPHFELPKGTFRVAEVPPEAGIVLVREVPPPGGSLESLPIVEEPKDSQDTMEVTKESSDNTLILSSIEVLSGDIAMTFQEAQERVDALVEHHGAVKELAEKEFLNSDEVQGSVMEERQVPDIPQEVSEIILESFDTPSSLAVSPGEEVPEKPLKDTVIQELTACPPSPGAIATGRRAVSFSTIPSREPLSALNHKEQQIAEIPHVVEKFVVYEVPPRTTAEVVLTRKENKATETRDENNDKNGSEEDGEIQIVQKMSAVTFGITLEVPLARSHLMSTYGGSPEGRQGKTLERKPELDTGQVKLIEVEPRTVEMLGRQPEVIVKGEDMQPKEELRIFAREASPLRVVRVSEALREEPRPLRHVEALHGRQPTGFNPSRFMVIEENEEVGIRLLSEERKAA